MKTTTNAKRRSLLTVMAITAIVTVAFVFTACPSPTGGSKGGSSGGSSGGTTGGSGGSTAKVQADKTMNLSFGTDCKVTIKSTDTFTTSEWNTLCNKVVTAIEENYKTGSPGTFQTIFASAQNTKIVLGTNFTNNWEVKAGEFRTAYIKIASIDTVNFETIVTCMDTNYSANE